MQVLLAALVCITYFQASATETPFLLAGISLHFFGSQNHSSPLPPVQFALHKLQATLEGHSISSIFTNNALLSSSSVSFGVGVCVGNNCNPNCASLFSEMSLQTQQEGFIIKKHSHQTSVCVGSDDVRGLMYGILELATQMDAHLRASMNEFLDSPDVDLDPLRRMLEQIKEEKATPRFEYRTIKFNLPWSAYRAGPIPNIHNSTLWDVEFWSSFLDMMVLNRFNTLTLWSQHPYPLMFRPTNYPLASDLTDGQLDEWKKLWHTIFSLAKDRDIETYIITWDIFVSKGFKDKYDKKAHADTDGSGGKGCNDTIVKEYNRQCVTQMLDEYPELTGLGWTLGEAMDGMDAKERAGWVEYVYFGGIQDAKRPTKIIYRAGLGTIGGADAGTVCRKSIESCSLNKKDYPIFVQMKYNWSHGHSTSTLVHIHGGTAEQASVYWKPPSSRYKITWMMRNEDFFYLRWGQADFIRDVIAKNGPSYVGGFAIGSEMNIPAKDYSHQPNSSHVTWKYGFEKQWLWYMLWGRLLYDPTTSDDVFESEFDRRYGAGVGKNLFAAYGLASRAQLAVASFYYNTWDFTLYSGGFSAKSSNPDKNADGFISIESLLSSKTLDPALQSISDYVKDGPKTSLKSPLDLAKELESNSMKAMSLINNTIAWTRSEYSKIKLNSTLVCELADASTWARMGLYMSHKLQGGVFLQQFRQGKKANASLQTLAIQELKHAQQKWKELSATTSSHFLPTIRMVPGWDFSWSGFLHAVQRDVDIAKKG